MQNYFWLIYAFTFLFPVAYKNMVFLKSLVITYPKSIIIQYFRYISEQRR